jgi:hypothetical protein
MPDGELVTAGYISVIYVSKFFINTAGTLERNFRFVGPGGLDGTGS